MLLMIQCVGISQNTTQRINDSISSWKTQTVSLQFQTADSMDYYWMHKNRQKDYKKLCLDPVQVFNVYVGLKQNEANKVKLSDCIKTAKLLDEIIQKQNNELQNSLRELSKLNSDIEATGKKLSMAQLELEAIKNKHTPWYRHPLLYLGIGIIGGVYITK